MASLTEMRCVPCRGGEPPLGAEETERLRAQVPGWQVVERDRVPRLERTFKFKDFREALTFTNQVGELAEQGDHHPAILTEYGKVTVSWWTHKIKGLHQNDFIMSAKTSNLYQPPSA